MGRWLVSVIMVTWLACCSAGCGDAEALPSKVPDLIGQVSEGASQEDVEKLLGPPNFKYEDEEDGAAVWQYNADGDVVYKVRFIDGQVAASDEDEDGV